ncbi:hypothetical protein K438DRAFT_1779809 [Mycena galopus ATCC 62051]|nr:hypothetical protein K438DRAFT_1779809 [Mycena galopus ATCC 62051]
MEVLLPVDSTLTYNPDPPPAIPLDFVPIQLQSRRLSFFGDVYVYFVRSISWLLHTFNLESPKALAICDEMPILQHIIPKETLQVLEIQTKSPSLFPNLTLVVINMYGSKAVPRAIPTLSTIAPWQHIRTIIIHMGSYEYGPDFWTESIL